jgi:hypothetical protein
MTARRIAWTMVLAAVSAGCRRGGGNTATSPNMAIVVSLTAGSVAGLGACPDAGAVGLVTSTTDGGVSYALYYCSVNGSTKKLAWTQITCDATNASAVAYVPGTQSLFVCADQTWAAVPIPPGPPGPQGLQGTQGPAGPMGAPGDQLQITPEPPGPNCASGGQRIDIGQSSVTGFVVKRTQYVCNGTNPSGGGCSVGASQCVGNQPQVCSVNAVWVDLGAPCQFACVGGACTACLPGVTLCASSTSVQACDSQGNLGAVAACGAHQACVPSGPGQGACNCIVDQKCTTLHDPVCNWVNTSQVSTSCQTDAQGCVFSLSQECEFPCQQNGCCGVGDDLTPLIENVCGGACVVSTDPNNCGACGHTCGAGTQCIRQPNGNGTCGVCQPHIGGGLPIPNEYTCNGTLATVCGDNGYWLPPAQYAGLCGCSVNFGEPCNTCGVRGCDDGCYKAKECDPSSGQLCDSYGNLAGSYCSLCSGDLSNFCNPSGSCECVY